ncbi:MAG: methyltransferase domain-containing protein [Clostridiaceae bacterium]|nr:methyltransferase domain-containing protein [Clostridiaceae bacterium]
MNHFNKTAERYDESYDGQFVKCMYNEIIERVSKLNAKSILDLGCGNGNILKILEEKANAKLFGLDLSENMIKEARKKLDINTELTVGDAEKLPYKDAQFDVVICNASFHHYIKPDVVVKEIKRVLKKNGVLILGDPTAQIKLLLKIINFFLHHTNSGDFKIYSKEEITNLLADNGLKVENYKLLTPRVFVLNAINI